MFSLTVVTFAYWVGGLKTTNKDSTATVKIGSAGSVESVVTVDTSSSDETLVPKKYSVKGETVDNVNFTFVVKWDGAGDNSGASGFEGKITAELVSVKVGEDEFKSLFTLRFTETPIISGTDTDFIVNLEFTDEPTNQKDYNKLATNTITVTIKFTVTPNQQPTGN